MPTRFKSPTPGGSAEIEGIVGRSQALPLSCEASSAVDWASFFGFEIDELEFVEQLPKSDNPDEGFVGNIEGKWGQIPPSPYGVHAEPVAQVLQSYGVPARAVRNLSVEMLKAEITAGRPVIVWVAGHTRRGTPVPYTASDGQETVVTRFEHTVMVTGYTEHQVKIQDGARYYYRTFGEFLDSWGVLGYMAIIWQE